MPDALDMGGNLRKTKRRVNVEFRPVKTCVVNLQGSYKENRLPSVHKEV